MLALNVPIDILDGFRSRTLRTATRSRLLTRVLARRETRIALLGSFQVIFLLVLTLRWPVAMYFIGPVLLGVVHVAADLRYLVLRQALPPLFLKVSLGLALALTGLRLGSGLHVANPTLGARVDIVLGVAWVAIALVVRFQRDARKLALVVPVAIATAATLARYAEPVNVALTHAHNLAALGLWLLLFRRGPRVGWRALPVIVVVISLAFVLSGAYLPWTASRGGLVAFGQGAARLGAGLAPGISMRFASRIAAAFIFLQSVHYAVWTGWIAQDENRAEGTPTFRMTLRSLVADFGRWGLAVVVLVAISFGAAACVRLRESVAWYMTLARAHVWFELAAFAILVGRPVRPASHRNPQSSWRST